MQSEQLGYLETRLADIDKQSEKLFLALGSGFPRVLAELRRNLESSTAYLERFVDLRDNKGNVGGQLNTIWSEAHALLTAASRYFSKLAVRDETVFEALRGGTERLSLLTEHIHGLREDALDMEVLAINAVIAARRAGDAGRGFAYIANELKGLAAGTVADTGQLADQGTDSMESLNAFQAVVEEIAAFQQEFFGEFENRLSGGFDDLKSGVRELSVSLRRSVEKARDVERPLNRIMEEIQIQDIIMQSVAHVMLVAERALPDGTVVSNDGVRRSMTQLCVDLLIDIRGKLAASLTVFKENLEQLRATLNEIGEDRSENNRGDPGSLSENTKSRHSALGAGFEESLTLLREITFGIQKTNDHRLDLREQGLSITRQLKQVLGTLASISDSLTRLYPIKVLSRVQIAKQPELAANRGAIEGIAEFTQTVGNHVGGSLSDISDGLSQIEQVVSDYSALCDADISVAGNHSADIESAANSMDSVRAELVAGLDRFSVFSDQFHELLCQAENDVMGIKGLVDEIDALIEDLGGGGLQQVRPHVREEDIGSVEDAVDSLVDRFTIARHKSAAASLVGIELENGSDEGELTIF